MTKRSLATLIAINVILFAALVMVIFAQPRTAQAQAFGSPGKYLMIAGRSPQRENQAAVYIIDVNSARMIAVTINTALRKDQIEVIAGRKVKEDIENASKLGPRR